MALSPVTPPPSATSVVPESQPGTMLRLDWRYHFLGIGGIGMSALAELLHSQGYVVQGSDKEESQQTRYLSALGIPVAVGHSPQLLRQAQAVVYSTAVRPQNAIWQEVTRLGLARMHRAELLGAITGQHHTLAVCGTHGKTTASAALTHVLAQVGFDPLGLIGGLVPQLGGRNLRLRQGQAQTLGPDGKGLLVVEADESDGSLLNFHPQAVLLTNVEADHLDHHGSLDNVAQVFRAFLARLPAQGLLVYCADDPLARRLGEAHGGRKLSYGLSSTAQVRVAVENMAPGAMALRFFTPWGAYACTSRLGGDHNAVNLAGVLAMALVTAQDRTEDKSQPQALVEALLGALGEFSGVERRQQFLGTTLGLNIFDDYAHHPTEIQVTLEMFLRLYGQPLTVVFQPHLYSRTQAFAQAFAQALSVASRIYITDIYGAREAPMPGVDAHSILQHLTHHPAAFHAPDWHQVLQAAQRGEIPPGVLLTLGAGDITGLGPALLALGKG